MAAGTLVVSVPASAKAAEVREVVPLAPPVALQRNEQTSIIHFLQRSSQLSEPRQRELAAILDGITHETGEDGVDRLRRIGAWYLGMR
jgi:hypothetical protein